MEVIVKNSDYWKSAREEFIDAQAGRCAICDNALVGPGAKLDHCHETGFIRGVLCGSCNVKLGWYEGRRRAIETYLANAAEHAAYVIAPPTRRNRRMPLLPRRD